MVDHVRTLLLNPSGVAGYRKVADAPADAVLALFGVSGSEKPADAVAVDRFLPLAMAPDLSRFRAPFDPRVTPAPQESVYTQSADSLSPSELHARVLSSDGWWAVSGLFQSTDPEALAFLDDMRLAAACRDAPYALGAVLLACAYRRLLAQSGGAVDG